jgi:hypothetical protein
MADLNKEIKQFHETIALSSKKKESLRKSRNAIRERIRKYFRDTLKVLAPKFQGQGSYSMHTMITPLDGEFDIDDGVYLQHLDASNMNQWPTPATVHQWLLKATNDYTNEKSIDKQTCVRMRFAGQYHVDLPAYGILGNVYLLANKGPKGWHDSDPKAITDWFLKQEGDQLRRIVRYLKAWADFQTGRIGKLPSGLILTVLATHYIQPDDRDDIALSRTVTAISNFVNPYFIVFNPVDGSEELTARLTEEQKLRFQNAIKNFADDAASSIASDDPEKASKLWRKQLGDRFPLKKNDEQNESQKQEDAARIAGFYAAKSPTKPWGWG